MHLLAEGRWRQTSLFLEKARKIGLIFYANSDSDVKTFPNFAIAERIKTMMKFKHTNRPGFWFGLVDFSTAGLFFLFYMPLSGLQSAPL